jgi:DNA-binding transcriptional regulator YiaG
MKGRGSVFMSDLDGLDGLDELNAFDAACMRAAWARPFAFATVPAQRTAPAAEAPADRQAEAPTTRRSAPPANVFEALRRLLGCNRQELAARLGISRHTLQRWERGQIPGPGRARVAELMRATLAAAQADWTMGPDFSPAALPPG